MDSNLGNWQQALQQLPESLHPIATSLLPEWSAVHAELLTQQPQLYQQALRPLLGSEFVYRTTLLQPQLLADLVHSGDLYKQLGIGALRQMLQQQMEQVTTETDLFAVLRRFRRRETIRLAWRDMAGDASAEEVMQQMSDLADSLVDTALQWHYSAMQPLWGVPLDANGAAQRLVVLGMGKLGAHELNFSSDIDLIYAFAEDGETSGGKRSISNQEFFIKLGQKLIQAIGQQNADGFVFRVDLRLRPFGDAGALALSFDAMEHYYQTHGREWERYAMVKARPIAGDIAEGDVLLQRLRPFVYRKYIDYGAFASLREMKGMIAAEVHKKGAERNIKLGAGGIREVEFIGQAFQLIRGGREPTLRARRILTVLEALRGFDILPDFVIHSLRHDYLFLRQVENRLQEYADKQTHLLPEDSQQQQILAWIMGYSDWPSLLREVQRRMSRVHQSFNQVFAAPQSDEQDGDGGSSDWKRIWQGVMEQEQAIAFMSAAGYRNAAESYRLIEQWRSGRLRSQLQTHARQRLNSFMPLLLGAVVQVEQPDIALQRILDLVDHIVRRSTYLALLVENPLALSQLVRLCHASPWIGRTIGQNPQLLDAMLDPRQLYAPASREMLANELHMRLHALETNDLEAIMEELRHFKRNSVLRVAAADCVAAIPLMVVSDYLTDIAEVIIGEVLEVAWQQMVIKHGVPQGIGDRKGFAVVAYGKFGGIELGYGSDLDLVFVADPDAGATDGKRPLDAAVFYARLAQKLVHICNTRTAGGILYEIDLRLRPSGNSGVLVPILPAFADYQRKDAWTWEHQALVRSRAIAGDTQLCQQFNEIRAAILQTERAQSQLLQDVLEMRDKMRQQLSKDSAEQFDIKQGSGGIVDIEFMVQYLILLHAHSIPRLTTWSDNIRQLGELGNAGLLTQADSQLCIDIYQKYRTEAHKAALQEQKAVVAIDLFQADRAEITRIWQQVMQ